MGSASARLTARRTVYPERGLPDLRACWLCRCPGFVTDVKGAHGRIAMLCEEEWELRQQLNDTLREFWRELLPPRGRDRDRDRETARDRMQKFRARQKAKGKP